MNAPRGTLAALFAAASLAAGNPAASLAHSGRHGTAGPANDEASMAAQHARMKNFEEAMTALANAIIAGDRSDAGIHAGRLTEALAGSERDVPHKNTSRIKEFRAIYGEMKKRAAVLATDARSGNLRKAAVSYGKVLELCAACHARFRD